MLVAGTVASLQWPFYSIGCPSRFATENAYHGEAALLFSLLLLSSQHEQLQRSLAKPYEHRPPLLLVAYSPVWQLSAAHEFSMHPKYPHKSGDNFSSSMIPDSILSQ